MAADVRGDLLGTETDVTAADVRWLSPLPLWAGILAGPFAWALDLGASYALASWMCPAGGEETLMLLPAAAMAIVAAGAAVSWMALRHTPAQGGHKDGGLSRQRARFMAILGLALSALFAVTLVAGALPVWVLDACD